MKILLFMHTLGAGGAERVTATLTSHWVEIGHAVTIVTLEAQSEDFYTVDPRIHRIALGIAGESQSVFEALSQNTKRIVAIRKIIQVEKPDIAIGIMTTMNVLLAFAGLGLRTMTIGTEHNSPALDSLGMLWRILRRTSYGLLDRMVALTDQTARWLQTKTTAKNVTVIPNPTIFPLTKIAPVISPRNIIMEDTNSKILLAVGRLVRQKRFDFLIKVFAEIASDFPEWTLVILGDGPLMGDLKKQVRDLALEKQVVFVGLVGNPGDWYEASDLLAMTSDFEGFSMVLVEALSYGTPVVSVDCDTGPSDIVEDGTNGLLVPTNDPNGFESALRRIMSNDSLREELANNAPAILEKFALSTIGEQWERVFAKKGT